MRIDGFDWDAGNWPKCAKHGVSRAEIEFVLLADPMVLPDRTPVSTETRFNAVGRGSKGRHIFVVFVLRGRHGRQLARPISARYMHRKEIARYEQRRNS